MWNVFLCYLVGTLLAPVKVDSPPVTYTVLQQSPVGTRSTTRPCLDVRLSSTVTNSPGDGRSTLSFRPRTEVFGLSRQ